MIIIFLLSVVLVVCGFVIGNSLVTRLTPHSFDRTADRVIVSVWVGVLVMANTYFAASLFSPLRPVIVTVITLSLLIPSLLSQQDRANIKELAGKFTVASLFGIIAIALGAAAYCSQEIIWYDTHLYHMQAIRWLSEYGLVPGMAQIHDRLGFTSSWFALAASVDHGILEGRIGSYTGGFCLLMLTIHLVTSLLRIIRQQGRAQDIFVVLAYLLAIIVLLLNGMPNSPSPDVPVIVLVIVIAWCMMIISDINEHTFPHYDTVFNLRIIPLFLAAGAVSIKLSALPLLAVSGCYYLCKDKLKPRKLIVSGIILIFFLVPLAAAGVITTGCAFYPLPTFCMDLPWSLGAGHAAALSTVIRDWARWSDSTPAGATSWNWIIPWLIRERLCSLLLTLSALSLLIIMIRYVGRKHLRCHSSAIALSLLGIGYMLYAAPNWRFGLGYLVILPAIAAANHAAWLMQISQRLGTVPPLRSWGWVGGMTALVLATHVYVRPASTFRLLDEAVHNHSYTGTDHLYFNMFLPPDIWNFQITDDSITGNKAAKFEDLLVRDKVGDFMYYRPNHQESFELCTDSPLPCAIEELHDLRLRDPRLGIAGGFVKTGNSGGGK